jgi:hypothetical protein
VEIPVEKVQKAQYVQKEGGHNTAAAGRCTSKRQKAGVLPQQLCRNLLLLLLLLRTTSGRQRMDVPAEAAPATLRFEFEKKTGAEKVGAGGIGRLYINKQQKSGRGRNTPYYSFPSETLQKRVST